MDIRLVCDGCGESFLGSAKLIGALCGSGKVRAAAGQVRAAAGGCDHGAEDLCNRCDPGSDGYVPEGA